MLPRSRVAAPVGPVPHALSRTVTTSSARFWRSATVIHPEPSSPAFSVALDNRPLKGPDGRVLRIPPTNPILARLVAAEWEQLPRLSSHSALPLSSLASRANSFAEEQVLQDGNSSPSSRLAAETTLAKYLDTDSILYMQDSPADLVAMQDTYWRPIIAWAEREFGGIRIETTSGIGSIAQPAETTSALLGFMRALPPLHFAAFERATLAAKSFLIATALVRRGISVPFAAAAARVEVDHQVRAWGEVLDAHDVDAASLRRDLASAVASLLDVPLVKLNNSNP
ncbi:ATP synthase complex assembly protein atp12 [Entophlyctis luteolus]|nr:ATP synthase complex assembly protein atp12 [Entophlyctis luteolus]KAJ3392029.1 ATP synthase complex assembly protein atp12 [Entophlyctis sp. JEL0112]